MVSVAKVGYSDNQNPYLKSNVMKHVGSVAALGLTINKVNKHFKPQGYVAEGTKTIKRPLFDGIITFVGGVKEFVRTGKGNSVIKSELVDHTFKLPEKFAKMIDKTKAGRLAYVVVPMVLLAGGAFIAGRVIGKAADLFINEHRAKKADKLAANN